jgi:hypothetical protein
MKKKKPYRLSKLPIGRSDYIAEFIYTNEAGGIRTDCQYFPDRPRINVAELQPGTRVRIFRMKYELVADLKKN